jgi:RNA polymerase sigma-70 factor, ECF subfamily
MLCNFSEICCVYLFRGGMERLEDIIEQIYSTYKQMVYNYLLYLTSNTHTAEDLTQETFIKVFKYFNGFKGDSSIKTWLIKISRNTYITNLKKFSTAESNIDDYEAVSVNDDLMNVNENISINHCLAKLSEKDRTLIILRDMNGFGYREISTIMECSEGQVKIGLFRARQRFKGIYDSECKEEF